MRSPIATSDRRLPRYQQLRDELAAKITDQVWRPGDRLPGELELAEDYAVSHGTIRRAIGLLVDDGVLERRPGSGTFVRRATFDASLFRFFRFQAPGGQRSVPKGRVLHREILAAPSEVARKLRLREGDQTIHLVRQRLDEDVPFLVEDIWLPLRLFAPINDIPLSEFPDLIYPLYEVSCGQIIASAEENLTAEPLAEPHAGYLELPVGTPVITIERLALGYDQQALEWRRSRGRADRFRYHVSIR